MREEIGKGIVMMANESDELVVLQSVPSEAQANLIAAALERAGIEAAIEGALTAAFRAEAPGEVKIIVRKSDLEKAKEALESNKGLIEEEG